MEWEYTAFSLPKYTKNTHLFRPKNTKKHEHMSDNTKLKRIDYYIGLNITCVVGLLLIPLFMGLVGTLRLIRGTIDLIVDSFMLPINAMNAFTEEYTEKKQEKTPKNTKEFDGFGRN